MMNSEKRSWDGEFIREKIIKPMTERDPKTIPEDIFVKAGADTGDGGHSPPPEFRIFCSYFQNSFSIACLRERKPSANRKNICLNKL